MKKLVVSLTLILYSGHINWDWENIKGFLKDFSIFFNLKVLKKSFLLFPKNCKTWKKIQFLKSETKFDDIWLNSLFFFLKRFPIFAKLKREFPHRLLRQTPDQKARKEVWVLTNFHSYHGEVVPEIRKAIGSNTNRGKVKPNGNES